MASISSYSADDLEKLKEKLKARYPSCTFFEHAAQKFAETLYSEFSSSVILARVYVTIPYGQLPSFNKAFVNNLAKAKNISNLINANTPILSLAGTAGQNPAWWERRKSQGHVGIPLCSAGFIDAIPMMSRLLQELGLNMAWFDKQDLSIAKKSLTGLNGLFYVANASDDTDSKGRKIIPAQDFVSSYGIHTVYGMGTTYISGAFAVSIIFTNEALTRAQISPMTSLFLDFKFSTSKLAAPNTWLNA